MGFLDSEGLAYFFREKIKPGLGGNGGGGSPIGTIISFMGTSAPAGYLVCDGAEYEITAYPALADFFRQQFGSANHFGGDGETTFAVPDMRNLFLRGFHGEAGEQLSGEMGERQEGTSIPYISSNLQGSALNFPLGGAESFELETRTTGVNYVGRSGEWNGNNILASYTVRPVNMAVLYCIKAVETAPSGGGSSEAVYSTEEKRIGTWIDGKILYQKGAFISNFDVKKEITYNLGDYELPAFDIIDKLIAVKGSAKRKDSSGYNALLPISEPNFDILISKTRNNWVLNSYGYEGTFDFDIIVEYTKITDQPTVSADMPSMPIISSNN